MRYITVEQFKEQPKEVQEVFLDWWQPDSWDLVYSEKYREGIIKPGDIKRMDEHTLEILKERNIPLFTLQQLWEFIEDKTNYPVTVTYLVDEYWVQTDDWWNKEDICFSDEDKLQAFWKCACEVARTIKVLEYVDQFIKDEPMD